MKVSDEQLISTYLECGGNQRKTAKQLGLSSVWVCKRLQRENAQVLLQHYRKQILSASLNKIISLNFRAIDKLEALLESENEFVQLQAIQKIITTSQSYFATEDILHRLDKLEKD